MKKRECSKGMSVGTLLQIVLVVLKPAKVITWSWVWVLAPTWIGLSLVVVLVGALVIVRKVKGL